uniref:Uncharacterized protein n=1 Tax=Arundo donax TaxID=35708 RepID=A0A0A9EDW0_ARUDO
MFIRIVVLSCAWYCSRHLCMYVQYHDFILEAWVPSLAFILWVPQLAHKWWKGLAEVGCSGIVFFCRICLRWRRRVPYCW